MSTHKQDEYIKKLAAKKPIAAVPDALKPALSSILGDKSMYVPSFTATKIIDALKALPSIKVPKDPNAPKITRTNWESPKAQGVIQQVSAGTLSVDAAAAMMGVKAHIIEYRTKWYRRHGTASTPEYRLKKAKSTSGKIVIVPDEFQGITQHQIDWAGFLGLEQIERFDLKVICSMFYAAERFVSAKKSAPELYDQKQQALRYIDTWAERFAKYTLAACAGEFGHRRRVGRLHFISLSRLSGSESGCQGTAEGLWDKGRETARKATAVMEEEFAEAGNFRSAYGGPKWAKIAKTLRLYLEGTLPAVVFADYVWDLSHNGGRFFDKCSLFMNESEVRVLLDRKKASKTADITEWAGAYLHPKWKENLDLLEAVNFEGGDFDA